MSLNKREYSYVSCLPRGPYVYDTVISLLYRNTKRHPQQEILIMRGLDGSRSSLTNQQLENQSVRVANFLVSKGIQKGDHVAIFGPNSLEWAVAEFGIIMTGGIAVHIASTKTDASDLLEIFSLSACRAIFLDPGENGANSSKIRTFLHNFSSNCTFHSRRNERPVVVFMRKVDGMLEDDTMEYILKAEQEFQEFPMLYPEDPMFVFTTSGSTGKPKMVEHTHFDVLNTSAHPVFQSLRKSRSVVYNDRPFAWTGGNPIKFVCSGETRVFASSTATMGAATAENIWGIVQTESCTRAEFIPYFIYDLIEMKSRYKDDFNLKLISTAGQIIDNSYTGVLGTFCENLLVFYGSTELSLMTTKDPLTLGDGLDRGDVGKVLPGVELKIVDVKGHVTQRGTPGEVFARSRSLCTGYFKNEESTREAFLPGGWFRTGDIAYMRDDGTVIIQGRIKDVISRGTRKIIPGAIEDVILQTEVINRVAVIGVPDKRLLEEVCVCFISENELFGPNEVEQYCRSKFLDKGNSADGLGDVPKYFLKFDIFPTLHSGKVDKEALKTSAVKRLTDAGLLLK